jgi:hypothetical protein
VYSDLFQFIFKRSEAQGLRPFSGSIGSCPWKSIFVDRKFLRSEDWQSITPSGDRNLWVVAVQFKIANFKWCPSPERVLKSGMKMYWRNVRVQRYVHRRLDFISGSMVFSGVNRIIR